MKRIVRRMPFPPPWVLVLATLVPSSLLAVPVLGPEEMVLSGGAVIQVTGYSVPSFVCWDGDAKMDLVVGEGSGSFTAKIRIYRNTGSAGAPLFDGSIFAQSLGEDLVCPGGGCLGCFPRVVYWDGDGKKDLLVGLADGRVILYININTDADPEFDGGTILLVGPAGSKVDIDVGDRATPSVVDWNNDGTKDLAIGAYDGRIHLFINAGSDTAPDFPSETFALDGGAELVVSALRSSPCIVDWNGDDRKDLLSGDTDGKLVFFANTGTDADPVFDGSSLVEADGAVIDLPGTPRSRPFACDWTGDEIHDVLIGAGDGYVRLYTGITDTDVPGVGEPPEIPVARLLAAYPNPFNPAATIPFELPGEQRVRLTVFDLRGRRVALLEDRLFVRGPNEITWNGETDGGRAAPSGVYFVRLETGGAVDSRKVVLVR